MVNSNPLLAVQKGSRMHIYSKGAKRIRTPSYRSSAKGVPRTNDQESVFLRSRKCKLKQARLCLRSYKLRDCWDSPSLVDWFCTYRRVATRSLRSANQAAILLLLATCNQRQAILLVHS